MSIRCLNCKPGLDDYEEGPLSIKLRKNGIIFGCLNM